VLTLARKGKTITIGKMRLQHWRKLPLIKQGNNPCSKVGVDSQGLFCCREWGLNIKLSLFIAKVEKASIAHWKEKTKNIAALKG
jgi:hypothetical protein